MSDPNDLPTDPNVLLEQQKPLVDTEYEEWLQERAKRRKAEKLAIALAQVQAQAVALAQELALAQEQDQPSSNPLDPSSSSSSGNLPLESGVTNNNPTDHVPTDRDSINDTKQEATSGVSTNQVQETKVDPPTNPIQEGKVVDTTKTTGTVLATSSSSGVVVVGHQLIGSSQPPVTGITTLETTDQGTKSTGLPKRPVPIVTAALSTTVSASGATHSNPGSASTSKKVTGAGFVPIRKSAGSDDEDYKGKNKTKRPVNNLPILERGKTKLGFDEIIASGPTFWTKGRFHRRDSECNLTNQTVISLRKRFDIPDSREVDEQPWHKIPEDEEEFDDKAADCAASVASEKQEPEAKRARKSDRPRTNTDRFGFEVEKPSQYRNHQPHQVEEKVRRFKGDLLTVYRQDWITHFPCRAVDYEIAVGEDILERKNCELCGDSSEYFCNGCVVLDPITEHAIEKKVRRVLFYCLKCQIEHVLQMGYGHASALMKSTMQDPVV